MYNVCAAELNAIVMCVSSIRIWYINDVYAAHQHHDSPQDRKMNKRPYGRNEPIHILMHFIESIKIAKHII